MNIELENEMLSSLTKAKSYFNYLLMVALFMVAVLAIGLFGYDLYLLVLPETPIEKGILATLGSLLILWSTIELIDEEIKHLRGGSSALAAFITLAVAALIRKILIISLSPEKAKEILSYGILVLLLCISYWLVSWTARSKTKPSIL